MKTLTIGLLFLGMAVLSPAEYTYTIETYQILPDLSGTESMLITGNGGGGLVMLQDYSSITIESTSTLDQGTGGVWHISLAENSTFYMTGGQINQLTMNNDATARLTGGLIQQIWSYQHVTPFGPHITIVYSGELPEIQTIHGLPHLLGAWGNGDPFAIYLSEVPANNYGYDPALTNIRFELIPEPTILALLGLGSLLLRRKKR